MSKRSSHAGKPVRCAILAAAALLALAAARAQVAGEQVTVKMPAAEPLLREDWPDAPSVAAPGIVPAGSSLPSDDPLPAHPVTASRRAKFLFPDQAAPPLTASDKVSMGLTHGISLYSAAAWVFAAEYEHVTNGTPNYGTDAGAYGQRLGAAALRGYSEEVLGTSVLAPLLREDPRFYKMSERRNVALRFTYAVTRTILTRNDSGHLTPNFQLVGGNLAGAALTNAYYPDFNRGFNQTLKTFEGSMAGSAFGFFCAEFLPDRWLTRTLVGVHPRHR